MAGIDKIYLKDYSEYKAFKQFLLAHDSEYFKKYNTSLLNGLYDNIEESYFKDGNEHPISNFGRAADMFIIQHLSESEYNNIPNVVARLKEQYYNDYDLIRNYKSEYDLYKLSKSRCKVKLIESTNNKCLRHIKREHWEYCDIAFLYNDKLRHLHRQDDRYLEFNYAYRCFYNWMLGCKYNRHDEISDDMYLKNISVKTAIKYITTSNLAKWDIVEVRCWNNSNNKHAYYKFIVS